MLRSVCVLLCSCLIAACSQGFSPPEPANQELQLNLMTEPASLDPAQAWDSPSRVLIQQLFEGLARIGPDGNPQPAMAKSIDVSADKQTYVFHLREASWSNGEAVTAEDFLYAWTKQLLPAAPLPMAEHLYVIKNGKAVKNGRLSASELGIYAPDDKTLVVALEHPAPYFLELVTTPAFMPVHQATDIKDRDWANAPESYVSNGPFLLKNWTHSDSVVVERNPNYWDAGNVHLSRINWVMIGDAMTELSLFEAGDLDWAGSPFSYLPNDAIPSLRASGQLQVKSRAAVYYYLLNTKSYPLQNRSFRRALAYAVDRDAIVEHILQSGEEPAMNLVPPQLFAQGRPLFPSYDPERAQKLFSQALSELAITAQELPSFTLSYNSNETHETIATAIQEQWRSVLGIDVTLHNEEWKVYLDKLKSGDYQIGRMGYNAHVGDPLIFLDIFDGAHDAENFTRWEDPAYASLVEQLRRASNPDKRAELIREAEQKLMEAMPIIPIYHYANVYLRNPRLRDVVMGSTGIPDFRWARKE